MARALSELFASDAAARYALVLAGRWALLTDAPRWSEGRYLALDLVTAMERREATTSGGLARVAGLMSGEVLLPTPEGTTVMDSLTQDSTNHAVGVSAELRDGLRRSVEIVAGDVVLIRYEGPKGGPGCQEMLYPTSYLKSRHLGKECALITDGRFSGGSSGLSIGHVSPEAAEGGAIGLVEEGDVIEIDIPNRSIRLAVSDAELTRRRAAMDAKGDKAWKPVSRQRVVSTALQAYGLMAASASRGAVRDLGQLRRR